MPLPTRIFSFFRTAARGLEAQRMAMSAATENIANAATTRTDEGTPYAIKRAVHTNPEVRNRRFYELLSRLRTAPRTQDSRHSSSPSLLTRLPEAELGPETTIAETLRLRYEYDPTHPHADANGYVAYPDVNVVEEMAHLISANRIYEANLSTIQAAKEIIKRTLEI